jgi:CRISPR-associated protein Cmr2
MRSIPKSNPSLNKSNPMTKQSDSYYLGITIGPVVKTLKTANKTRHLWAASYTFSYLMKEIAKKFNKEHSGRQWLKPAMGDAIREVFKDAKDRSMNEVKETGAGLFPDHIIVSSSDIEDVEETRKIVNEVISEFSGKIAQKIKVDRAVVESHLKAYFQINIIRKKVAVGANPILVLSEVLNTVELHKQFGPEKEDFLTSFFDVVSNSFLTNDAFGKRHSFLSIPEIGLTEFLADDRTIKRGQKNCRAFVDQKQEFTKALGEPDDQYHEWAKEFIRTYNEENKEDILSFLTGHKYVAIVQSDGDSIGRLLNELPQEHLPRFSEKLTEFAAEAAKMVKDRQGMPVYFGGDDALFFAPVVNGQDHIFQLLADLNTAFKKKFDSFKSFAKVPALSFGLSISFSKYPLYEALEQAQYLLFSLGKGGVLKDKELKDGKEKEKTIKNNIVFRVLKHSGSAFGGVIHLDESHEVSLLNLFKQLFELSAQNPSKSLMSLIYFLPKNKEMLGLIAADKDKLVNFLDNSFDEPIHKNRTEYIDLVSDLIHTVYKTAHHYPKDSKWEALESPDRIVYSLLKTIAFLTSPEN